MQDRRRCPFGTEVTSRGQFQVPSRAPSSAYLKSFPRASDTTAAARGAPIERKGACSVAVGTDAQPHRHGRKHMIPLTRLNGDKVAINPDRIERADITPDVVLTMTDGSKFVIHESLDELIDRIRLFRASVLALSHRLVFEGDDASGDGHLRVVRGATSGTVVDTHEVIGATRPVNLRAVDGGSAPAAPPATTVSDAAADSGRDIAPS